MSVFHIALSPRGTLWCGDVVTLIPVSYVPPPQVVRVRQYKLLNFLSTPNRFNGFSVVTTGRHQRNEICDDVLNHFPRVRSQRSMPSFVRLQGGITQNNIIGADIGRTECRPFNVRGPVLDRAGHNLKISYRTVALDDPVICHL